MGKYTDIQNEVVKKYGVDLCDGTKCKNDWRRTHAHRKERRVCKWVQKNSIESTFELLHEIGHIENNGHDILSYSMRRAEAEYFATKWAIFEAKEYGIEVPKKTLKLYADYIQREIDRGKRRGLKRGLYTVKEIEQAIKEWL